MIRINKFLYGWKILVHYGQGWEYETFETAYSAAKQRIQEYRANAPEFPVKIVRGRETNPEYERAL